MPQYDGKEVLTIGKFDAVREVVNAWFSNHGYLDLPTPYKPGHEGPMWVLSYEGMGDWTFDITQPDAVVWPPGVYAEAVNGWCLGLYPARDEGVDSEAGQLVRDWERAIAQGRPGDEHMAGVALAQFVRDKHLS